MKAASMAVRGSVRSISIRSADGGMPESGGEKKLQRQASATDQGNSSASKEENFTMPLSEPAGHGLEKHGERDVSHEEVAGSLAAFVTTTTTVGESNQKTGQPKSNQEKNDELRLKAQELETLFAAEKLRILGDHSGRRQSLKLMDKNSKLQLREKVVIQNTELVGSRIVGDGMNVSDYKSMDVLGSRDRVESFNQLPTVAEPSVSSFYERYMQMREAKIREEPAETRARTREKLNAMMESLESDSAQMKARFWRYAGQRDAASQGCNQEKPMEDEAQAASQPRGRKGDDTEVKEDSSEKSENNLHRVDVNCLGETRRSPCKSVPGGASSKVSQVKKSQHKRSLSLTNPLTAVSSARLPSNSHMGKHSSQTENPLGQSASLFSDFREENSMPSKATAGSARPQVWKFARSKSVGEDIFLIKDDKQRQSQFMKKTVRVMGR